MSMWTCNKCGTLLHDAPTGCPNCGGSTTWWSGPNALPTPESQVESLQRELMALRQALTEAQQQRDRWKHWVRLVMAETPLQAILADVPDDELRFRVAAEIDALDKRADQAESRLQQIAGMRERIKAMTHFAWSDGCACHECLLKRDLLALLPAPGQE